MRHCVAEVRTSTGWHWHPCYKKRGHGPDGDYCSKHAKMFKDSPESHALGDRPMRRYGRWATPENPTRCAVEVTEATGWHPCQCVRKRGHGPDGDYCWQHARMVERGKHVRVPGHVPNDRV